MHNFVHEMLHNSPAAQRIEALWLEYEEGESAEARFVKGADHRPPPRHPSTVPFSLIAIVTDLDRFEMASQASEYEKNHGMRNLQGFFDSSLPNIKHPEVQQWGRDLMAEREIGHSHKDTPAS
ncbi:hypothetical protein NM688_g1444 [Phlebia brevispora]|uniref:Uncharacterized protein n=1 Tax=Phlebia brevispora TaxID=194682 RepID=A0ACC1TBA8_9APHY|nr:hypothetical protein NM688_g1444 [Phlebia brevispora]